MQYLFVNLILLTIGLVNANECNITEIIADKCAAQLLFIGNRNFTLPKDDSEILEICQHVNDGIRCYKSYIKNCLSSFAKQVMALVTKNGQRTADMICKSQDSRKEFLEHFHCFKSEEFVAPMHLCMDKFIVQMEQLPDIPTTQRIPSMCCSYHTLRDCLKTKAMVSCEKKESVEYVDNIATEVTGDMIEFTCAKYQNVEQCDANTDNPSWKMLKDLVASDDPKEIAAKKKYSSPFIAIKNILAKFKN